MTSGPSAGSQPSSTRLRLDPNTAEALAQELETALRELMKAWFPRSIDEKHGGYLCDFDHRWRPSGRQLKMLEFQGRTACVAARVAAQSGFEPYREAARHGFEYLRDVMWDHKCGGWFRMLDRAGNPLESCTKHGHGTSYAIGACVAYYNLTSDPQALDLAQRAFRWIDQAAHDDTHGGYFVFYRQDGTRITSRGQSPDPNAVRDGLGVPIGLKDANTNADLLEAFADLYQVSPDPPLKERLTEMLHIVRDRVVVPPALSTCTFSPIGPQCRTSGGLHRGVLLHHLRLAFERVVAAVDPAKWSERLVLLGGLRAGAEQGQKCEGEGDDSQSLNCSHVPLQSRR